MDIKLQECACLLFKVYGKSGGAPQHRGTFLFKGEKYVIDVWEMKSKKNGKRFLTAKITDKKTHDEYMYQAKKDGEDSNNES
jgi:hypothetical protein